LACDPISSPLIHVAVVDDDLSVGNGLRRLLTTIGFQAAVFKSGREFLRSLGGCRPDCLILDLNMPGMTGRELLQKVSEQIPNLPVIIVTAADNPEFRAEYDRLGATAYLLKPVQEKELVGAIGAALKIVDSKPDDLVRE
jgi:two-component system response regulator FixJ